MKTFFHFRVQILPALFFAFALSAHAFTVTYERDAAGRLDHVIYAGASNTAFSYDSDGNLLTRVSTTNPFIPIAGSYDGLVAALVETSSNTGTLSITLAGAGSFTGSFNLAGVKYSFHGAFDPGTGLAQVTATPSAPGGSITLNLTLDLTGSSAQVTGSLSGGVASTLSATLAPFNRNTNPVPGNLVGSYTALLTGTDFSQGTGFGVLTVGSDGTVKFAGALADGTRFSQGSTLDQDEIWLLYLLLYNKAGFVSGGVAFSEQPGVSDFAGNLAWMKPVTAGPIYPGSFTENLSVIGSKYIPPVKKQRVLNFPNASPDALFTASGGNLATSPLPINVTLTTANKVIGPVADPNHLKLSISTSSGLISGSFLDGAATPAFNGVVFQKQSLGGGFFLGTSESGVFTLEQVP